MNSRVMCATPETIVLDGRPLSFCQLARTGAGTAIPVSDPQALHRAGVASRRVESWIRQGHPLYGTTTGVGALKDVDQVAVDSAERNSNLIAAHHFGTGAAFPATIVRNAITIRANTALTGQVGCSIALIEGYLGLLRTGVLPVVRRTGSIGCADLGLMAQISAVLIGSGEACYRGKRMPANRALAMAGLDPIVPGPRDGLAAIAVNAVGLAAAVGTLRDAAQAIRLLLATALATADALGAARAPWKAAAHTGSKGEAEIGAWLDNQALLSDWQETTRIQDPLSLRMLPQVFGAACQTLMAAGEAVLGATGRTDDNPVVVGDEVLTSGASLPLGVTLQLQSVQLALAHIARNAFNRCVLLGNGLRPGLPVNLVPPGTAATGLGPIIKLAGEIFAREVSLAQPVSPQSLVTAGGVEDEAAFLPLVCERLERQVLALYRLAALEAILTAQAADLLAHRGAGVPRLIRDITREHVAFHAQDRPLSAEVEALEAALAAPASLQALISLAPLNRLDDFFALAPVDDPQVMPATG